MAVRKSLLIKSTIDRIGIPSKASMHSHKYL